MPATKFKVTIGHATNVARVEGLLVKVVRKPQRGPGLPGPDRYRRSICDYKLAQLNAGPPAEWELTLDLPTGAAKKGVVAYDIEVVMLDAANNIVDSFCKRRKKPAGILIPPIIIRKPGPFRKPSKA